MFATRTEAGEKLADLVAAHHGDATLVLAIPRGGLPVARPVADELGVALDIVAAKKMGMPGNPEFAIGAAASDGTVWRNDEAISRYDISEDYIEHERERATETAREKLATYRGEASPPTLTGERVVIVDDGVATGATARACLMQADNAGAERVVLAVPVAPRRAREELEQYADDVLIFDEAAQFGGVGAFYTNFEQVSDEEARAYLEGTVSPR